MKIEKIEHKNDGVQIDLASYVREDFVDKSLSVYMSETTGEVWQIYFSSYDFGNMTWKRGVGTLEVHRWETEDEMTEQGSFLTRHFPQILSDGVVDDKNYEHGLLDSITDDVRKSKNIDTGLQEEILRLIDEVKAGKTGITSHLNPQKLRVV